MARQLNLSNDFCLFCSDPADPIKTGFVDDRGDPIILDDEDVKAKVLKALCNHLMPQNLADIPVKFSEDMYPYRTSCKDLVAELWECQEVIRKTQLRLTEITTTIEKKVGDDVLEAMALDHQIPSAAASSEKRFIRLRDVIFKHYKETLIIKRKEKLSSIHLATSSPVTVIPEVYTAEDDRIVIISSWTKSEPDINEATRNEYDETALPGVSISTNVSDRRISQHLSIDNDPLFEEEHHVFKSGTEDLHEDKASEAKDQPCVNQVVASASPPVPTSEPLQKTSENMSITRSAKKSLATQKRGPRQNVARKSKTFEGTDYEILKDKRIYCFCCNQIYKRFASFKLHVRRGSHECSVCKQIFTQPQGLKSHYYKFHGAGKDEKFPCPHCGFQYNWRYALITHLRDGCFRRKSDGKI